MTTHKRDSRYDQRPNNLKSSGIKNMAISHNSAAAARKQQKTSIPSALLKRLRIHLAACTWSCCCRRSAGNLSSDRQGMMPAHCHNRRERPLHKASTSEVIWCVKAMLRYFCYHFKAQTQVL